ncbi:MAG TPA: BON domain-containing protein [Blastocatellia bacterium]|nr:BON domain-containing protein [Blastocatellia bacterium]
MARILLLISLLLLAAGGGYYVYRHGLTRPQLFGSSADAATSGKVKTAFGLSKRLSGYDIKVETDDGIVTLSGQVGSDLSKSLAGEIARDTPGVKEVFNNIEVDPGAKPSAENSRVDDLEIRASILESFARSPELSGKNIDISVEDRKVTLSGSVDTKAQSNGAEQAAGAIGGVAGVTNNLSVTNPEPPAEPAAAVVPPEELNAQLAKQVEFELYRTGAFDTLALSIKADQGNVTLSGKVRSRAEQLLAERVAQGTPGVKKVVNELQVASAAGAR